LMLACRAMWHVAFGFTIKPFKSSITYRFCNILSIQLRYGFCGFLVPFLQGKRHTCMRHLKRRPLATYNPEFEAFYTFLACIFKTILKIFIRPQMVRERLKSVLQWKQLLVACPASTTAYRKKFHV